MFRFLARLFGRTESELPPCPTPQPPETLMRLHRDQPLEAREHQDRKRYHSFANTLFRRFKGKRDEED